MPKQTQPIIDWDPTPGFLLAKPMKREEVAALYARTGKGNLSLPDKVGKVSDSVGVGQIIKIGEPASDAPETLAKLIKSLKPGDIVGHIPFVDALIEIDGAKYSIVPTEKIMAVRRG